MNALPGVTPHTLCYHCGDPCQQEALFYDDRTFCCTGCRNVYSLLSENGMCDYYALNSGAGASLRNVNEDAFAFLDEDAMAARLLQYKDEEVSRALLYIPHIHCSSCIWLLENLQVLIPEVQYSSVDFVEKQLSVQFRHNELSFRSLALKLQSLGYEPVFHTADLKKEKKKYDRRHWYRIGVAGFGFGNIMLLSLPEYFDAAMAHTPGFALFFRLANIAFALPVLLYSSAEYLRSGWNALRSRVMNIDIPIALGIIVLFGRSLVEIAWDLGPGYLDSFCGLIFFMSIGRAFQQKTYEGISFERDYTSYFPISVQRARGDDWEYVPVTDIRPGDRIRVKNQEIIPADSILEDEEVRLDAAFVTGESRSVRIERGGRAYAGCRVEGAAASFVVEKEMSEGHLTRLWNHKAFQKDRARMQNITDRLSYYFTPLVLVIALAALLYQGLLGTGWGTGINALTAVLIIACPCALGLAAPFGFGTFIRQASQRGLFLKNPEAAEQLAGITHVVFDKTGTLTHSGESMPVWEGQECDPACLNRMAALVSQSSHPLSMALHRYLNRSPRIALQGYQEIPAAGIAAQIGGKMCRLGSAAFCGVTAGSDETTRSYYSEDGVVLGHFRFANVYRQGLQELIAGLGKEMHFTVLSGDSDSERTRLQQLFPRGTELRFRCSPSGKLEYVEELQARGERVLMLGDGLNDAGALKVAHMGISITDNNNQFCPAADAILEARSFSRLPGFIKLAGRTLGSIRLGFAISLLYNVLGIAVAVSGGLSPVFAAILMPLSSVTVVSAVSLAVKWQTKKLIG